MNSVIQVTVTRYSHPGDKALDANTPWHKLKPLSMSWLFNHYPTKKQLYEVIMNDPMFQNMNTYMRDFMIDVVENTPEGDIDDFESFGHETLCYTQKRSIQISKVPVY